MSPGNNNRKLDVCSFMRKLIVSVPSLKHYMLFFADGKHFQGLLLRD